MFLVFIVDGRFSYSGAITLLLFYLVYMLAIGMARSIVGATDHDNEEGNENSLILTRVDNDAVEDDQDYYDSSAVTRNRPESPEYDEPRHSSANGGSLQNILNTYIPKDERRDGEVKPKKP